MSLSRLCFLALAGILIPFLMPTGYAADSHVYTDDELLALASAHTADDRHHLPLGDGKYVLDAPRQGYIYLCNLPRKDEGGAQAAGPWIHGTTWDPEEKIFISGNENWPNASFTMTQTNDSRLFVGNGLPLHHPTGFFPVPSDDPAFRYDHNPNRILPQSFHEALSLNPTYTDPPYCMGMEVGVMLSGVPLFNGFDAGLRDAAAHEIQDRCNGHPQQGGQYHYHSLSACIPNTNPHTILGYALDGFPITGGQVAPGQFLMTRDLDVCHGLISKILRDGQSIISYHYVMTPDFPYSASCFRAAPSRMGPRQDRPGQGSQGSGMSPQPASNRTGGPHPPSEAMDACKGRQQGQVCDFMTPRGDPINGLCLTVRDGSLACVPGRP